MIAQSLCRVLFSILILIGWTQPAAAAVLFQYVEVDSAVAGDCKAAGDLAGYGYPDLVGGDAGGKTELVPISMGRDSSIPVFLSRRKPRPAGLMGTETFHPFGLNLPRARPCSIAWIIRSFRNGLGI